MSIFPEVYKKATSMINSSIEMPCEDGAMSVVPTNKAKEAIGVMQEEIVRLEQQLAKANETISSLNNAVKAEFEKREALDSQLAKANERVEELEGELDIAVECIEQSGIDYEEATLAAYAKQLRKEREND